MTSQRKSQYVKENAISSVYATVKLCILHNEIADLSIQGTFTHTVRVVKRTQGFGDRLEFKSQQVQVKPANRRPPGVRTQ